MHDVTGIFGTAICGRLIFGNRLKPISWLGFALVFAAVVVLQSEGRVQAALQSLQTTSPNFAILASIDLARRQMMQEGPRRLEAMMQLAEDARTRLNSIHGIQVLGPQHCLGKESGFYALDTTKLLIDTSQTGWSGADAQRFLNRRYGVQPELSAAGYVLCILTLGSTQDDIDHLMRGLEDLSVRKPSRREDLQHVHEQAAYVTERLTESAMTPREAFYSKQKSISLTQAVHCISGEIITPYPPGIPVIMPGERFSQEMIELLVNVKRSGYPISAVDPSVATVRIVS